MPGIAILLAVSPSSTLDEAGLPGRTLPKVLLAWEAWEWGESDSRDWAYFLSRRPPPPAPHHEENYGLDLFPSIYTYLAYNFSGLMESLKQHQPCWHHKSNRLLYQPRLTEYLLSIRHCPRCFIHIISLNSLHNSKRLFICISKRKPGLKEESGLPR